MMECTAGGEQSETPCLYPVIRIIQLKPYLSENHYMHAHYCNDGRYV